MEDKTRPHNFWTQMWQDGTIRFHQHSYNSHLVKKFNGVDLNNQTVLIPLAGKTLDILFFLEKGAQVTAIEFVEQAVVDFFSENKIPYTKKDNAYQAENLIFYVMNFFDFKNTKTFDVFYDRASQVVFSLEERPKYYQHVSTLIDQHTSLFLSAIDHAGSFEIGPPHKIPPKEIIDHYLKMGIALKIFSEQVEATNDRWKSVGVMTTNSYYLTNA